MTCCGHPREDVTGCYAENGLVEFKLGPYTRYGPAGNKRKVTGGGRDVVRCVDIVTSKDGQHRL